MDKRINKSKEKIIEKLSVINTDLVDIPKIIVCGKNEITIENHKGIRTFERNEIRVNSRIGVIKIEGESFEILYISGDTIIISGVFKAIIYEGYIK
ncbi:MAG: sporulation protein YqfC [Clostridium sp.]|nr:sporulation protein YqfC [Clostridium sp.]